MVDLGSLTFAGLGLALSPLPLLLAVALLDAGGVTQRAVAFVGGEAVAVALVTASAVFLLPVDGGPGRSVGFSLATLEVTIGAALALLLVAHLRSTRRGQVPYWLGVLDRIGPRGAFGGGVAMVAANPKNLALSLAGAGAILDLTASEGGEVAAIATFTLLGVSVLVALLVLVSAFPLRAQALLAWLREFVVERERMLVTIILGALAAYFVARGLLDTRG